jgi:hypothetical protein
MAASKSDKIEIPFEFERETKTTKRFDEPVEDYVVGKLYVKKSALETIGDPEKLKVTIEPA